MKIGDFGKLENRPFGMVNECHEMGKNLPCQSRMFEIIRQRKMYIEQNKHY